MSGYYHIACHVNIHFSGTTYSHFCIKNFAKKALKKQIIPKFPQKQTKNPPLETSKSEHMLKMTHVMNKKQKCQKNKRPLGSGRHNSQNQEYSVRNFRFQQILNFF